MKQAGTKTFKIAAFFLFFLNSCISEKENVMRNSDIGLIIINKGDFENRFIPIVQNFNEQVFYSVLNSMKEQLKLSNNFNSRLQIGDHNISFEEIHSIDDSSLLFKKKILEEVIEKYAPQKIDSLDRMVDIDILQPMLFYTSAEYFKDKFYHDLLYYPPLEFTIIFNKIDVEANKPASSEVEFINPYYPLCNDLEEEGQIYHLILKKEMLIKLKGELHQMKATGMGKKMAYDFAFLEHVLNEAIHEKILVIRQITP